MLTSLFALRRAPEVYLAAAFQRLPASDVERVCSVCGRQSFDEFTLITTFVDETIDEHSLSRAHAAGRFEPILFEPACSRCTRVTLRETVAMVYPKQSTFELREVVEHLLDELDLKCVVALTGIWHPQVSRTLVLHTLAVPCDLRKHVRQLRRTKAVKQLTIS